MSNTLAIADVTSTLVNLLQTAVPQIDSGVVGVNVTALPLDKALDNYTGNQGQGQDQLNVFLYHVVTTAFWRNQAMPLQSRSGETAQPPLGLTLHYLLSAWSNTDDVKAHRILSAAMLYLHDHPVFNRSDLAMWLSASDLSNQIERVRITEEPLTVDEMYKLWSAFQTHYRVSAAYQVGVVLVDSSLASKAPLPVLQVQIPGPTLTEWTSPSTHTLATSVQPTISIAPLAPTLTSLAFASVRPFALYGEVLTVYGYNITGLPSGTTATAQLSCPALSTPTVLSTTAGGAGPGTPPTQSLTVTLSVSSPPPYLPAGIYTLTVDVATANKPDILTNALPFTLAPQITTFPTSPVTLTSGSATVTVVVSPAVQPNQKVFLIVGDQLFSPTAAITSPATSLSFTVTVTAGSYYLRVRVDGADSPVLDATTTPPTFLSGALVTFL